jgi:hypothetical protein
VSPEAPTIAPKPTLTQKTKGIVVQALSNLLPMTPRAKLSRSMKSTATTSVQSEHDSPSSGVVSSHESPTTSPSRPGRHSSDEFVGCEGGSCLLRPKLVLRKSESKMFPWSKKKNNEEGKDINRVDPESPRPHSDGKVVKQETISEPGKQSVLDKGKAAQEDLEPGTSTSRSMNRKPRQRSLSWPPAGSRGSPSEYDYRLDSPERYDADLGPMRHLNSPLHHEASSSSQHSSEITEHESPPKRYNFKPVPFGSIPKKLESVHEKKQYYVEPKTAEKAKNTIKSSVKKGKEALNSAFRYPKGMKEEESGEFDRIFAEYKQRTQNKEKMLTNAKAWYHHGPPEPSQIAEMKAQKKAEPRPQLSRSNASRQQSNEEGNERLPKLHEVLDLKAAPPQPNLLQQVKTKFPLLTKSGRKESSEMGKQQKDEDKEERRQEFTELKDKAIIRGRLTSTEKKRLGKLGKEFKSFTATVSYHKTIYGDVD